MAALPVGYDLSASALAAAWISGVQRACSVLSAACHASRSASSWRFSSAFFFSSGVGSGGFSGSGAGGGVVATGAGGGGGGGARGGGGGALPHAPSRTERAMGKGQASLHGCRSYRDRLRMATRDGVRASG
jgi:hypothetical protein